MATVSQITQFGTDRVYPNGIVKRRYEVVLQSNTGKFLTSVIGPVKVPPSDTGVAQADMFLEQQKAKEIGKEDIQPEWNDTQADYYRRALGKAMTITDVLEFYEYVPVFQGMQNHPDSGANAIQRAVWLGVPIVEYNEMAQRFNDILGIEFFIVDAKDQIWMDVKEDWK